MSNKITVRTGDIEDAAKEFIDIWHKTEKGHAPPAAIEKINFKDQRLLFKTLTPKRFEMLKYVHEKGSVSIRKLAKELGRDYSNVHHDVKILYQLGLMLKDEKNDEYSVPWDVIVTEIPLTVLKKPKKSPNTTSYYPPRAARG